MAVSGKKLHKIKPSVALRRLALAWANLALPAKGLVVVAAPLAALVLATISFYMIEGQHQRAEAGVRHTLAVRSQIGGVLRLLLGAETAVRGYLLTGRHDGLELYQKAREDLPNVLARLEALVQDNPAQLGRMPRIKSLARQKLDAMAVVLKGAAVTGTTSPKFQAAMADDKAVLDDLRRELETMQSVENRRLAERRNKAEQVRQQIQMAIGLGVLIGLSSGVVAVLLFTTGISHRVQQLETNARHLAKGLPRLSLPPGNDQIGRLGQALEETGILLDKQSERLTQERNLLRTVIDNIPDLIFVKDTESRFVLANLALVRVLGLATPEEVVGRTDSDFFPAPLAEQYRSDDQQIIQSARPLVNREEPLLDHAGCQRWLSTMKVPLGSQDGRITGLMGISRDITQRKQFEDALERKAQELALSQQAFQAQNRILQCVVDSMGDGVVVADEDGKFLLFNPAAEQILRLGAIEAEPGEWTAKYGLYLPDTVTPYPAGELPLVRAMRGESVDAAEVFVRHANMQEGAWVSVTARPLKEKTGAVRGGVVVFRDITPLKRTEEILKLAKEQADRANRAKSEFLSRMSHELRTPLNAILGFAQLLEIDDLTADQRESTTQVLKAGRHLLQLINEVLDIARIEAGRLALSPEPIHVGDLVCETLELIEPLASNRNIELRANPAQSGDRHVLADRQRLKQVLLNLLSNAVKYNRSGGTVTLSYDPISPGRLRIQVTDTGMGISAADLEKLFTPFERLQAERVGVEGTGLGLALSERLVKAMGGTIGVQSTLEQGSTFWVELSLVESPVERLERDRVMNLVEAPPPNDAGTVLYIEDNLSNLRLMERILAHRPEIKLLPAMQGQLGLDLAREHSPDLIFLDLHLPDIRGDEILRRLQEDPRTRDIPEVIISADATPGQIDRLLSAGARAYLTKPLDVKAVLKILDETLKTGPELCEKKG